MPIEEPAGAKELVALVPELYFDLISRVPPGAFLLLALGTDASSPWQFDFVKFGAWTFLLFVGAAYTLGMVLVSVAPPLRLRYQTLAWQRRLTNKRGGELMTARVVDYLTYRNSAGQADYIRALVKTGRHPWFPWRRDNVLLSVRRQLHDDLKSHIADAKGLLPKISAEAALFTNLQLAVLIFALLRRLLNNGTPNHSLLDGHLLVLVAGAFLLLAYGAFQREDALVARELSYLSQFLVSNGVAGGKIGSSAPDEKQGVQTIPDGTARVIPTA